MLQKPKKGSDTRLEALFLPVKTKAPTLWFEAFEADGRVYVTDTKRIATVCAYWIGLLQQKC